LAVYITASVIVLLVILSLNSMELISIHSMFTKASPLMTRENDAVDSSVSSAC